MAVTVTTTCTIKDNQSNNLNTGNPNTGHIQISDFHFSDIGILQLSAVPNTSEYLLVMEVIDPVYKLGPE